MRYAAHKVLRVISDYLHALSERVKPEPETLEIPEWVNYKRAVTSEMARELERKLLEAMVKGGGK